MKTPGLHLLLLIVIHLLYGCSTTRIVTSEIDKAAFTESYRTFNFYDLKAGINMPEEIDPSKVQLLKDAIAYQLNQAGLRKASEPDLWVNIGITVEDKVQTRQTDIREAPIYIGQRRYSWQSEEIVIDKYRLGTVSIDFIDASSDTMIAQASAQGVVEENEQDLENSIKQAIAEVFKRLWNEDN